MTEPVSEPVSEPVAIDNATQPTPIVATQSYDEIVANAEKEGFVLHSTASAARLISTLNQRAPKERQIREAAQTGLFNVEFPLLTEAEVNLFKVNGYAVTHNPDRGYEVRWD